MISGNWFLAIKETPITFDNNLLYQLLQEAFVKWSDKVKSGGQLFNSYDFEQVAN